MEALITDFTKYITIFMFTWWRLLWLRSLAVSLYYCNSFSLFMQPFLGVEAVASIVVIASSHFSLINYISS